MAVMFGSADLARVQYQFIGNSAYQGRPDTLRRGSLLTAAAVQSSVPASGAWINASMLPVQSVPVAAVGTLVPSGERAAPSTEPFVAFEASLVAQTAALLDAMAQFSSSSDLFGPVVPLHSLQAAPVIVSPLAA